MKLQQVVANDQIKVLEKKKKILQDQGKIEADEMIQLKATNKELLAKTSQFGAIKKELQDTIIELQKKHNGYNRIKYVAMQESIQSLTELLAETAKRQKESEGIIAMLKNERDDAYDAVKDERAKFAARESMYFKEADIRANGYVQVIDKLSQELEVAKMGASKKQSLKRVSASVQTGAEQGIVETKLVRKRIDIMQVQNSRNHQIQELQLQIRHQKNDIKTKDGRIDQLNRVCRSLMNMKEIVEVVAIE